MHLTRDSGATTVDRIQLQTIIGELDDGVVIIETDGTISWANPSALRMHGVEAIADLGGSIEGYHARFALSYRNNHTLAEAEYPGSRVLHGEAIRDILVNVTRRGEADQSWTHKVRSLVLDATGEGAGFCVLIIDERRITASGTRHRQCRNSTRRWREIRKRSQISLNIPDPACVQWLGYKAP